MSSNQSLLIEFRKSLLTSILIMITIPIIVNILFTLFVIGYVFSIEIVLLEICVSGIVVLLMYMLVLSKIKKL